jgi:transposase
VRFSELEHMNFEVSQAWKVKELFRDIMRHKYSGDYDAYAYFYDWCDNALQPNIEEINGVVFMFKRHQKSIIRSMITGANNGKAERMNGSIQEIKTVGRGYRDADRFRIAILFFHGKLDPY